MQLLVEAFQGRLGHDLEPQNVQQSPKERYTEWVQVWIVFITYCSSCLLLLLLFLSASYRLVLLVPIPLVLVVLLALIELLVLLARLPLLVSLPLERARRL